MRKPDPWRYASEPAIVGWYATLYCWDSNEGSFPGANWWTGMHWQEPLPVYAVSPTAFSSEEEAKAWADKHDPDL
jgi:hypothetical protein